MGQDIPVSEQLHVESVSTVTGEIDDDAHISPIMKITSGLVYWSPSGLHVAVAKDNRLTLRDATTLQIVQQFSTLDMIQAIGWSPDSHLVLTAMYKRGIVQVWSVKDGAWTCKITEGIAGMIFAKWAPDSRHIITVSDFQLHATVWSLRDCSKYIIRHPKLGSEGFSFTSDGNFLAVAERTDCKDAVGIYNCDSWELVSHFQVDSYDLTEILWSPDNVTLAIRDTSLEYRVLFYSLDGSLVSKYEAYENALGLKSMAWSSSGHFIALGSFDEHLRILNHLNWKPIAELNHETIAVTLNRYNKEAIGYEEVYTDEKIPEYSENGGKRVISTKHATCATAAATAAIAVTAVTGKTRDICFVIRDPPFSVVCLPPDPLKENPKMGLSRVVWSFDSSFIAIKSDSMPCYVWIWHTETLKLHAMLSFLHAVTSLRWDPEENRLAIAAGENRVHLWTKEGISWIDVPCYSSIVSSTTDKNSSQPFKVLGVRWHPKGKTIAAFGRFDCCTITL